MELVQDRQKMKIIFSALLYVLVIVVIDWEYSLVNDITKIHLLAVDLAIFGVCFAIVTVVEKICKNTDA
mgnify:CR=1 FL=1